MDKLNSEAGVGLVFIKGTNLSTRDYVFGDLTRREDGSFFVPYANRVTNEIGEEEIPTEVIRRAMKLPERGSVYAGALDRAKYLSAPRNEVSKLETIDASQEIPLNTSRNGFASRIVSRVYDGIKKNLDHVASSLPLRLALLGALVTYGGVKGTQLAFEWNEPLSREQVQKIRVKDEYDPIPGNWKAWRVNEPVININKREKFLTALEAQLAEGPMAKDAVARATWSNDLEYGVFGEDGFHENLQSSLKELHSAKNNDSYFVEQLESSERVLRQANQRYVFDEESKSQNGDALLAMTNSIRTGLKDAERIAREDALKITREYLTFIGEMRDNKTVERMVMDKVTEKEVEQWHSNVAGGIIGGAFTGAIASFLPLGWGFWYDERKKKIEKERKLDREIEKALLLPENSSPRTTHSYDSKPQQRQVSEDEITKALIAQEKKTEKPRYRIPLEEVK